MKRFDRNHDGWLNREERQEARAALKAERAPGGGRPFGGGPRGRGGNPTPSQPGPRLTPADVPSQAGRPVYDPGVLRTFFLEFDSPDWEAEMADFKNTDVELPATLTVDGRVYRDVGVHFRGMSSFGMVGAGWKRSLNLSLDFVHRDQNLGGYRSFELLNSHEDPSFLRTVLFLDISREYLPAPKANFVQVAINGEGWGVYVSQQPFNKDYLRDAFGTTAGARWKVPGSPRGRGSLAYLGDDPQAYQGIYTLKSKADPAAWADLVKLCQVLNQTPADRLEKELPAILDVDGALKFLALENTLINNDGYWVRTSDYCLYQDEKKRFH
ncbi:MAG: CotH kinase family protein, partial [Verrucomicrobiota bacterium]